MNKCELLNLLDEALLDSLYGFCYARTRDSHEAQDLCSEIIVELVRSARGKGSVTQPYPFIWRIARNVYADFSDRRRRHAEAFYCGDADSVLAQIAEPQPEDDRDEQLAAVYQRIAFLTRTYREVMILYYLDGRSTSEIAALQGVSEGAIRQRLFSARKQIRSEVDSMSEYCSKPISLNPVDFAIIGNGNPGWGDPRNVCTRQFSRHIVWLCRKKPRSAAEIAAELNVPTVYVEEELEILAKGENGKYGLLRRTDSGKYAINFILLDKEDVQAARALYDEYLPAVCRTAAEYVQKNAREYLSFPYLNCRVSLNLVLWQQIYKLADVFPEQVERILQEKFFVDVPGIDRPFSVYGSEFDGKHFGGGCDGISASNLCGYTKVYAANIYLPQIHAHFHCAHNMANDPLLQLALRAVHGLKTSSLSENEKEYASKAVECGYLHREGDTLFTKILVSSMKDSDRLFAISTALSDDAFDCAAQTLAERLHALIRRFVPGHLLNEWRYVNHLASAPVLNALVEHFIKTGLLTPPEDGIGAGGCWMQVDK